MIKIIHLSDFHLESEEPSFDKLEIVKSLADDLKKFADETTILFFTGDLIDKGAKEFQNKENAFQTFEKTFINPILEKNPVLKGRIFVIPGNHDVFRNKIDTYSEAGLKATLTDVKGLNSFISENRTDSKHLDRLSDYKKWEFEFYKDYVGASLSNFENTFKLTLGKHTVGITALNSSWLCKDELDKENILLGKNQIENSLRSIDDCQVKLALAHHPMEFYREFDRESSKVLMYKKYDIFFTGHVHELASSYTQELFGNIFISIANSTIADSPSERKHVNGYSVISLYPNDRIHACYRKYVEEHKVFVPNTDIGTETGCKEFKVLKDDKLAQFELNQSLVNSLENKYCEKLNEHIIMSSSATNTACTIDNLFVEPTILNCPQDTLKEEDTIRYTIDEILGSDSNFLIFGLKEAGKTILLDKMFIEAIRRFNQFDKIPVLLKFSDFKKKEAIKVLKEFLSMSSKEIELYLEKNRLILFIDDFQFGNKSKEQIDSLKTLVSAYKNIQVIATADQLLDNVIPTDYLDDNDIFNFNLAFIQNFSSSEIRQLIVKWFAGRPIDLQENMQKLIKSFVDFGLPKNPLTITLFLWIFEKQENRPINSSALVELFIENLLEKTNIENIYSETFDFKNKRRLLSFVSKFMRDNGNEDISYSVDYVDLLNFVKEYLQTRFAGQPQKVLDDFIRRGILTFEDDNLVRFKSAFFFHYFLALHMDNDPDFKQHVFKDENYLNYVEEIGYYTGLKRDDLAILNFTQEKLHNAFGAFNEDIKENYQKVDSVLESKQKERTVTFQIDEEVAENKLSEKQMDEMYDQSLSNIPVQKSVPKKDYKEFATNRNVDMVLKLAATVLKNSEDVDDFEAKKIAYRNVLTSSISFLMQYRDALIVHYHRFKKQPDHFPKNIDFNLFIKILPLIHQVVTFNWVGTQKLRPVIIDKIENDKTTLNISEFEKALSIFMHSDIRGTNYPEIIKDFVKQARNNYIKDLSFLKIMSYYHLRNNGKELDNTYLRLMADIKADLGTLDKNQKSQFMKKLEDKKKGSL